MADDVDKKPKFILNKQKSDSPTSTAQVKPAVSPAAAPAADAQPTVSTEQKKKVVVVKKKVVVAASPESQTGSPKAGPSVAGSSTAKTPEVKTSSEKELSQAGDTGVPAVSAASTAAEKKHDPVAAIPDSTKEAAQGSAREHLVKKPETDDAGQQPKRVFEINSQRPNVKAGNLSERPKRHNDRNPHARDAGGFTGAQAREGYQNRFNENRPTGGQPEGGGGYPRRPYSGSQGAPGGGYQGAQGGYQGGGYQGRNPRYPGQGGQYGSGGQGVPGGYQGGRPGGYQGGYQGGRPGGYQGGRPGVPGQGGFGRPNFGTSPASTVQDGKKGPVKRTFKGKKTYTRRDKEEEFAKNNSYYQKKKEAERASAVPDVIEMMETISVSDLARKMNLRASDIIGKLMSMGMMVTINQSIDSDTATLLAEEYNCKVHIVSLYDETVIESDTLEHTEQKTRPPVVTIMGHVDHGKTKTLDAIRSTHVAEHEFGGITQHIGAYMVETPKGKITFLDTPGHEAFTMMRSRGAKVTDIVVLVVAADDGVMPQTIEAIDHAKAAEVPIIVALNKIDKPEANPDRVKTQLSELGLTPEDWGGETQFVPISALKKEGLDNLLDAILIQAEVLELTSVWDCRAEGKILESKIDHGRGVVSTVVIEQGTLKLGDSFVAGIYSGKVRALYNDLGVKITEATPSMPVEVLGMENMPMAGDPFQVTDNEKTARTISSKRQDLKRFEDAKNVKKVTLDNLYSTIEESGVMELKVIIKADVQGSAEALSQALEKLSTKDVRLVVIHSSAGAIIESDVMLAASDTNAIIIGFNVRPSPKAKALAEQSGVEIRKYNIIYKAVEEITLAMEGLLKPDVKEEVIGMLEVREVFKVPKAGTVAGSYVKEGIIKRTSSVNIIRDNIVIYSGKVSSLRRFKDDVKEVATSFECGVGVDNWQDIQVGDQFEVIEFVEVARKLSDSVSLADEKKTAAKKKLAATATSDETAAATDKDEA